MNLEFWNLRYGKSWNLISKSLCEPCYPNISWPNQTYPNLTGGFCRRDFFRGNFCGWIFSGEFYPVTVDNHTNVCTHEAGLFLENDMQTPPPIPLKTGRFFCLKRCAMFLNVCKNNFPILFSIFLLTTSLF